MQQDLHINGRCLYCVKLGLELTSRLLDIQYATVIAILFVTYCPGQIPSNMVWNHLLPQLDHC